MRSRAGKWRDWMIPGLYSSGVKMARYSASLPAMLPLRKDKIMLLVIDVGNTNTVLGVFDGEELVHDWRIRTVIENTIDEYGMLMYNLYKTSKISSKAIEHIIISCVVPPMLNILEPVCEKYFHVKPLIVGPGVKTGMPILYDNPKEVGADRIVNAVAVYEKYKREAIVVDFGTATTFDYVSPRGEYMGGCIAPGIVISSEALFTAGVQAAPGGVQYTQVNHCQGHGEQHAGGHYLRICRSGGRDCGPHESGSRFQSPGDCNRWPGQGCSTGDEEHRNC